LVTVDVASGWTELQAVWGKGMQRVGAAVHETRRRLPVPLRALHTDNGSEFLNELLGPSCRRVGIRLTRGRPSKKNDQAHVEQKNGAVVRRLVGYDRFASQAALAQLPRLDGLVRLAVNFLQPVRKLVGKERVGARGRKRFDPARTPSQRLLATGQLDAATAAALAQRYAALNPVTLRADLDAALEGLWRLAERAAPPAETSKRG
jgi:transposase InsO family protein